MLFSVPFTSLECLHERALLCVEQHGHPLLPVHLVLRLEVVRAVVADHVEAEALLLLPGVAAAARVAGAAACRLHLARQQVHLRRRLRLVRVVDLQVAVGADLEGEGGEGESKRE